MISKRQIIVFLVALGLIVSFVALGFRKSAPEVYVTPTSIDQVAPNPSTEVDKVSISEQGEYFKIKAVYPKANSEAITNYFKNYIEDQISQFKEDTKWVKEEGSPNGGGVELTIDYRNIPSSSVQNYVFSTYSYTGGAHGMQIRKTFSFNRQGQLLTVSSLFNNGLDGLGTFSKLVQKELLKRENADAKWIAEGAGAKEENYQSFVVKDNGVTILFDQYQVAPYSDGQIDITIPAQDFRGTGNPEIFPSLLSR